MTRGLASAVVDGFLVLGGRQGVRAVIDVATGAEGAESLAADPLAEQTLEELPDHRVAEVFLSADGVEEFVAAPRSPACDVRAADFVKGFAWRRDSR